MKTKTLLLIAGGGVAAYFAWKWWKSRPGAPASRAVRPSAPFRPYAPFDPGVTANTTGGMRYAPGGYADRSAAERAAAVARNRSILDDPRYLTPQPPSPDAGVNGVTFRDGEGEGL